MIALAYLVAVVVALVVLVVAVGRRPAPGPATPPPALPPLAAAGTELAEVRLLLVAAADRLDAYAYRSAA
ncbi:hypothetical protein KUG12_27870 [Streptomyces sp. BV333]|uniref:hypothetical protein n=1 Tax=Streptomyces sp. BV333 TaxID=2849673 RepID=UPI001C2E8B2F|nr:hypothetical protein [Streptomyces sp. BV333]MBV1958097.1 hypothetical protein [Streptomyces sp. BV333]